MEIVFIIFVALLIFLLIIHMILLFCGTNIGKKGHKNMMIKSLFGIAESLLSFVIVLIWFINFNPSNKAYLVGIAIFGIVLFISCQIHCLYKFIIMNLTQHCNIIFSNTN